MAPSMPGGSAAPGAMLDALMLRPPARQHSRSRRVTSLVDQTVQPWGLADRIADLLGRKVAGACRGTLGRRPAARIRRGCRTRMAAAWASSIAVALTATSNALRRQRRGDWPPEQRVSAGEHPSETRPPRASQAVACGDEHARFDDGPAASGLVDHRPCGRALRRGRDGVVHGGCAGAPDHLCRAAPSARSSWRAPCRTELGVRPGERIATLAWNDHRHFELYYGIAGMGAVCHTINPRLFPEQIAYIINHAEDRHLFVDPMFLPLVEQLAPQLTRARADRRAERCRTHAGKRAGRCHRLREPDRRSAGRVRLAGVRRDHGVRSLLHLGHDRPAQGRALPPPLDRAARARPSSLPDVMGLSCARDRAAGGADVPRQRLGPALRLPAGRRAHGDARAAAGRRQPVPAVRARAA